jgi:hypothetical protein
VKITPFLSDQQVQTPIWQQRLDRHKRRKFDKWHSDKKTKRQTPIASK